MYTVLYQPVLPFAIAHLHTELWLFTSVYLLDSEFFEGRFFISLYYEYLAKTRRMIDAHKMSKESTKSTMLLTHIDKFWGGPV